MKDLKHYFTENVKSCEASNGETKEVTNEPENGTKANGEAVVESPATAARRKRSRVKIKISQTNNVGPVCDIVESKNDLIDKTPSPFTSRGDDVKINDESSHNETPKRSNSLPRKSGKNGLVRAVTRKSSTQSTSKEKNQSGDENDNLIAKMDKKNIESPASTNGRAVLVENAAAPAIVESSATTEREESNAFQVLMTRKKSPQFTVPAPLSAEEEELAAKVVEENKAKLKHNKEKLIALADKKGYTKRKLGELEESEKIERRLEKRAKVFKAALIGNKKESEEGNSPVMERRVMPGSLHNYFNKTTPEQKEKELTTVSTLVVKADVHIPECIISGSKIVETKELKLLSKVVKIAKAESSEAMAKINDIQVIETENFDTSMRTSKEGKSQASENGKKKKPRWSLRINLQCNNVNGQADSAESQNEDKTGSGKRESKPRRSKIKSTNYEENEGSESDASTSTTTKVPKKRKSATNLQKTKTSLAKSNDSPIILDLADADKPEVLEIEQTEVAVVKQTTSNEKLAPLFMKKQKPDAATVEARRLFLHSLPEENGKIRTEKKLPIVGVPILPFPTISHVTQLHHDEAKIECSPFRCNFPIREKLATYATSYNLKDFKSVTNLNRSELSSKSSKTSGEIAKENVEEVLSEIESRCADAREIWSRISTTANGEIAERRKSPKRKGKKRKSHDKKVVENVLVEEKIAHDGIWTHKYRPMSTQEIVGNEEAASKLRDWLDGWKTPLRKDESSGDEFYSSDCSFATVDNNQVAVLLGPHGSGKTASVYAIAEELGYSVIEVNASSKRAGKKLLKELEEATKSHRIKKSEGLPFLPIPQAKKSMPKNSLILVEDVDLIFEEDEGFISATCQLASNTKRPIVMTGRDTCSHLNRMAPQQLRIYYQTSVGSRVSALLELITLAESGYKLPGPCLDRLLQNGDLRKALLQLQFLLLSGKPHASQVPTNFHRSLWQDMRHNLYKPAIKAAKKPSKKKLQQQQKLDNSEKIVTQTSEISIVKSLANDLERISFISTMIEVDDPALEVDPIKLEPGMSLDENMFAYSNTKITSMEIAKWLRDRVMNSSNEVGESDSQNFRQLELKKELNAGVNLALAQVSPFTLDGRLITLDYLPSLRAICRSEEVRVVTNNKRGNRFYHYLQSLRLPSTSTRPNILAAACRMMRDKNSDS